MTNPDDCRFAKTHEWVHLHGDRARVGISDHAQKEITDVVFVELPKLGRAVKAGESCAIVESVKAAFDIYAPVSGQVVAVNDGLGGDPGALNRSPYDQGWLFEIKTSDASESKALMAHEEYQAFLKAAAH